MPLNRRHFIATASLAAVYAALPFTPAAAARWANFTPIRRGVGTFEGRGGTMGWLASEQALVVVDTQFPDTAQQCWDGLQERTKRHIDLLINSHHHGDHTGGNAVLQPHAQVHVAHRNVPILQKQSAEEDNAEAPTVPNQTFDEAWDQDVGDETMRLRYYGPAHTSGDAVIHFEKANIVHMGDLVFNRRPPFIDVRKGASTRGWISVMEQVHADFSEETVFIYGHSNPSFSITGRREDLLVQRDFLEALLEHVETGMKAGHSEDELAKLEKVPGFPDHYLEDRPDRIGACVRAVYRDLDQ